MPSFSPYNDAPEIIESPEIRQITPSSGERGMVPRTAPSLNALFAPLAPDRSPEETHEQRIKEHIQDIVAWSSESTLPPEERAVQLLTYIQTCAGNQHLYELLIGLYLEQMKRTGIYRFIPGEHVPPNIEAVIAANGWRDLYEPAKERFLVYEKLLSWGMHARFVLGLDHEQVKAVRQALRGVDRYYDQMCIEFPDIPEEQRHEMIVAAVREKLAIISQTPPGELRRHATFGQLVSSRSDNSKSTQEEQDTLEEEDGDEREVSRRPASPASSSYRQPQSSQGLQDEPLDFSGPDRTVYHTPQEVYLYLEGLEHSGQHLTGSLTLPADPAALRALDSALRAAGIQLKVTKTASYETTYLTRLARELEEEEF